MNKDRVVQYRTSTLDDTLRFAAEIGQQLRGGEVIELASDVGGGKTTFVRGIVTGMGSIDRVSSPSFTLSNQYQAGSLTLYHFDFYRLQEPGIMANELAEVINDPQAVVVIEWANIVEGVLPEEHIIIQIKTISETGREFTIVYPDHLAYVMEAE